MVFKQKIQKKIGLVKSEKFHLELACSNRPKLSWGVYLISEFEGSSRYCCNLMKLSVSVYQMNEC